MLTSTSLALLATNGVFLGLAIVAVLLRFIVRSRFAGSFGKDDWFAAAALFFSTGVCLTNIISVSLAHSGANFADLTDADQTLSLKLTYAWQFFYILAVGAAKLSFLFFYGRFFHNDLFLRSQRVLLVLVGAWTVAFFFCTIFQAWPVYCNWTYCSMSINYPVMYICTSATDIALDLAILVLPLYMLRNIQLNPGKRRALGVIFGLGAFCIIAGTVRLAYTVKYRNTVDLGFYINFTPDALAINMWSGIEAGASTICACLPCFGPFVTRIPYLHRMAESIQEPFPWDGSPDQYTGALTTTRSRGRSRFRRYPIIDEFKAVARKSADILEEGSDSVDYNSINQMLPPLLYFESPDNLSISTRRHAFEPSIEDGRIMLRTDSSGTDTDSTDR